MCCFHIVPPKVRVCTVLPVYDNKSNTLKRIEVQWEPMYIVIVSLSFTAVTYTTNSDSSRRKNEIVSVVLTTTSETEAGLELLVTVATPDTQQDIVIEGTFQTGIRKAMGKVVFSKLSIQITV